MKEFYVEIAGISTILKGALLEAVSDKNRS